MSDYKYSRDELLLLRTTVCSIQRGIRKLLFHLQLWLPSRFRCATKRVTLDLRNENEPFNLKPRFNDKPINAATFNTRSAANKSASIVELISVNKLDLLALTEVWQQSSDDVTLTRLIPQEYQCIDAARTKKVGRFN